VARRYSIAVEWQKLFFAGRSCEAEALGNPIRRLRLYTIMDFPGYNNRGTYNLIIE
jgi:hypothetical protein